MNVIELAAWYRRSYFRDDDAIGIGVSCEDVLLAHCAAVYG
jgi:hypothetical protein